jgi:uncharacterized protein with GYD domain
MPMYLFQGKYTPETFKRLIAKPQDRTPVVRRLVEAAGGKLHHLLFAFGEHDVVALLEYPDNASAAGAIMAIAAGGALSGGQTTVLLTAAEAAEAMKKAGSFAGTYKTPE